MIKRLHKQRIRLASYPHDTICPNPGQQLKVNKAKSPFWYPVYNGDGEFEVQGARTFVVKLIEFSCACGAWQLSGIPCEHAITCITYNGGKLLDYVDPAFLVGTYTWAYTVAIRPLNDSSQWLPSNGPRLRAPTVAAMGCGPKQKKRRASVGEFERTRVDKCGRSYKSISKSGQKQRCSLCEKEGHNREAFTPQWHRTS
ncbi:hypothetical protein LINPERPRIM_LOCUS18689 [Linum perenne]